MVIAGEQLSTRAKIGNLAKRLLFRTQLQVCGQEALTYSSRGKCARGLNRLNR